MPYFINENNSECDGVAVEKENGDLMGCHPNKESAIKQMVAISLQEGIEPAGERLATGPLAVISDIDGILLIRNELVENSYDYLEDMEDTAIFLVTARTEKDRDRTESRLKELELDYTKIFFMPEDSEVVPFKTRTAEELLKLYNVIIALDDREDVREAYRGLGITALDLNDIPKTLEANYLKPRKTKMKKKNKSYRAPVAGEDKFTTEEEALDRAEEIGCEGTHTMDEDGQVIYMPCSTHAAYDAIVNSDSYDEDRIAVKPAAKKDQIVGSGKNKPDSAKGAGGSITFDEKTTTALKNKVTDHNEKMTELKKPRYTRTTLGQLKAVYRRGSGAFSGSNRPGISRAAWSMARVNAYLYLLQNERPKNSKYITDNDLLPPGHPKSTRNNLLDIEEREVNLSPPSYMRAAARRGLEFNRDGKGGAGLTDKTKQEAREMAEGRVSEDKWLRIAPWIARHLVDLDAPDANPSSDNYPSAGVVAHLLWGSGPTKQAAMRTMNYAEGVSERIKAEENRERWLSVGVHLEETKDNKLKVESRVRNNIDFEIRLDSAEADGMKFTGYAAVFNSNSEPLPFTERILEGAFSKTLKSRNEVKLFKNHNSDEVLASTRSKTLKLREDGTGLLAEATLPDTTAGRDLAVLMQRGDVHSMSFGFTVPEGGDTWNSKGNVRELREIRLHEVSIVTGFPAYRATTASVRSLDILAKRTLLDADKIADVLLKLESGETLPDNEADLLLEIVGKLREAPDFINEDIANLNLKRKELDLLFKVV